MRQIKKIAVCGAGALGVMYGSKLQAAFGDENVFFIASKARIERYEAKGMLCNGEPVRFRYAAPEEAKEKADLILFAVKYIGLAQALEDAAPFADENTIFLSVLNGIASEKMIGERFGTDHLLYSVVHGMDATKAENAVSFSKVGTVVLGDKSNALTDDVRAVCEAFDKAGIDRLVPEDIMQRLWSKLMLNAGVNQVTAVYGLTYDGVQKPGRARELVIAVMEEARRVANAEGINLPASAIDEWLPILDSLSPNGKTSLRQDVDAGRKTEKELFSGTICALGKKHGLPTPLNEKLYEQITALENGAPFFTL